MFELGDDAVAAHTAVGTYAAEVGVDLLVTVGPAASAIAQGYEAAAPTGSTLTSVGRDAACGLAAAQCLGC